MSSFHSRRVVWLIAFVGLLLPYGGARGHSLYKTTRILEQKGNACQGASLCTTTETDVIFVDAGAYRTVNLRCPGEHPYFLGWDATRHEHITVAVVTVDAGGLTLVVGNGADAGGSAKVFLGCTEQSLRPTSYLQSVGAVPTNRRAVIRNAP